MANGIYKAMKTLEKNTNDLLKQIAYNCDFYKTKGKTEHYKNEIGVLRGIMYVMDEIGIEYPRELYYKAYVSPMYEKMNEEEPMYVPTSKSEPVSETNCD